MQNSFSCVMLDGFPARTAHQALTSKLSISVLGGLTGMLWVIVMFYGPLLHHLWTHFFQAPAPNHDISTLVLHTRYLNAVFGFTKHVLCVGISLGHVMTLLNFWQLNVLHL